MQDKELIPSWLGTTLCSIDDFFTYLWLISVLANRTQFRYYGKQVCENNLNKVDWRELEESTVGDVVKQGTVAQRLHKLGQELGIPVLLAIRFCYEGDNNIHDGVQMASLLNGYLGLIQNEGEVRWIMPESWSVLLNNPHVNPFLFGWALNVRL